MKKKQLLGFAIAAAVFVFVSVTGILTSYFYQHFLGKETKGFETTLKGITSTEEERMLPMKKYIGIVKVEGAISSSSTEDVFGNVEGYDHEGTLDYIDEMIVSDTNQAILLFLNTPGGTVYASDELYLKLMEYKKITGRPVYAYMSEMACSGGYYISMAADKVIANRNTTTGSVGVIMQTYSLKGLYDKIGVEEITITSGENKALGSEKEAITDEQRAIYQSTVDECYEQFTRIVADGRKLPIDTVKKLADGRIYTAKQALENKLIDEIKTYEETIADLKSEFGENIEIYEDEKNDNPFISLFSGLQSLKGKSDSQVIVDEINELTGNGNGVPMYYAKP